VLMTPRQIGIGDFISDEPYNSRGIVSPQPR
jgi:hypothetical protein